MADLLDDIRRDIRSHRLLPRGQAILVAVSGGSDSMVLWHVLNALVQPDPRRIVIAHFNHQLRGRDSDRDAEFVTRWARERQQRCCLGSANVAAHARKHGVSIEMAARELRHDFLARTARTLGLRTVALGHHADDQVELFWLRLLRGSGPAGLAGMDWSAPSPADRRVRIVRPLLGQTKDALLAYARQHTVRFRQDRSNLARDALRNRVRLELLPWLNERFQTAVTPVILRTMELLGSEHDCVETLAQSWMRQPSVKPFHALHRAVQRAILHLRLRDCGVAPAFDRIEWLRTHPGEPVSVGPGRAVIHSPPGELRVQASRPVELTSHQVFIRLAPNQGQTRIDHLELRWHIQPKRGAQRPEAQPNVEYFDANKVGPVVRLRHWQPGDRYHPIGLAKPIKLQDAFVNLKVPRAERGRRWLALTEGGIIFWVEGLRISELFKLDKQTSRRLKWHWFNAGGAHPEPSNE